jgi:hypothetical protein
MRFDVERDGRPEMTVVYGFLALYSGSIGFLLGLAF